MGSIEYFIINLNGKEGDPVAAKVNELLHSSLSKGLIKRIENGTISEIISSKNREKFRNPPAHTRYMPYYIALEARDFVLNVLWQLNEWNEEK